MISFRAIFYSPEKHTKLFYPRFLLTSGQELQNSQPPDTTKRNPPPPSVAATNTVSQPREQYCSPDGKQEDGTTGLRMTRSLGKGLAVLTAVRSPIFTRQNRCITTTIACLHTTYFYKAAKQESCFSAFTSPHRFQTTIFFVGQRLHPSAPPVPPLYSPSPIS